MCNCSSSFFCSLPVLNARLVKPNSETCRWRLKRIQHSILNCFWIDSKNSPFLGQFSFIEKPRDNFICCLSSSLSNEEDVVHQTVGSDSVELPGESDLVRLVGDNDLSITGSRGFKQSTTRSNLVAKQVVSIQSALSLGFISQLWVDTTSWLVLVVDVKPSLLSGESERFLLTDIVRISVGG